MFLYDATFLYVVQTNGKWAKPMKSIAKREFRADINLRFLALVTENPICVTLTDVYLTIF